MQKITLFYFPECPHCRLAQRCLDQLREEKAEYRSLEIEMIDENKNPEIAEKYDYYYVPTFYVGAEKVHEGHAEAADVKKVLDKALAE